MSQNSEQTGSNAIYSADRTANRGTALSSALLRRSEPGEEKQSGDAARDPRCTAGRRSASCWLRPGAPSPPGSSGTRRCYPRCGCRRRQPPTPPLCPGANPARGCARRRRDRGRRAKESRSVSTASGRPQERRWRRQRTAPASSDARRGWVGLAKQQLVEPTPCRAQTARTSRWQMMCRSPGLSQSGSAHQTHLRGISSPPEPICSVRALSRALSFTGTGYVVWWLGSGLSQAQRWVPRGSCCFPFALSRVLLFLPFL